MTEVSLVCSSELRGKGRSRGIEEHAEVELRRDGIDPVSGLIAFGTKPVVDLAGVNWPDKALIDS